MRVSEDISSGRRLICWVLRCMLGGSSGTEQHVTAACCTAQVAVARSIIAEEGVGALYRGLSAGLLRQATYTTARLGIYNYLSEYLNEVNQGKVKSPAPLLLPCHSIFLPFISRLPPELCTAEAARVTSPVSPHKRRTR
jgi:hypothetical protein